MAQAPARAASVVRLFDAHCHLQDPRVLSVAPSLIRAATAAGVARFAVNGTSEVCSRAYLVREHGGNLSSLTLVYWISAQKDWHLVKQMAEEYPSVVPCFGLHPWQDSLDASPAAVTSMLSGS
uniref:OSJNBa0011J08.1 protein n=1 Tax=Oryza sativa subsp. japonica TaxID=39947 RepID=Q7XQ87_ORYSJ|nr:OSJNBa0011J08.1 [Oryza sativa Japonica Group]